MHQIIFSRWFDVDASRLRSLAVKAIWKRAHKAARPRWRATKPWGTRLFALWRSSSRLSRLSRFHSALKNCEASLLQRGLTVRYINPLCEVCTGAKSGYVSSWSIGRWVKKVVIRELKLARFWDPDGNRKCAISTFNLPSHNHIHIAKYLFFISKRWVV